MRKSVISRKTNETDIKLSLNIDGKGNSNIATGIGFFDHMLEGFTKHGQFDLDLSCKGDLHVDYHHTVEDVALTPSTEPSSMRVDAPRVVEVSQRVAKPVVPPERDALSPSDDVAVHFVLVPVERRTIPFVPIAFEAS